MWFRIQTTSGGSLKSDLNKIKFETSSVNAKHDFFRIKSITRVCRAKSLIGEKVSCFLKNQLSVTCSFFLSVHILFKIPQTNHIRDALFTCLRKHEYLQYPKMWCQFRCLNYRYRSDILILNVNWHQCEQRKTIIRQQYIIELIFN